MISTCTIVIEPLDDGRFRASCPVFPDLEAVAVTEEAARIALGDVIERAMRNRLDLPPLPDEPPLL